MTPFPSCTPQERRIFLVLIVILIAVVIVVAAGAFSGEHCMNANTLTTEVCQ